MKTRKIIIAGTILATLFVSLACGLTGGGEEEGSTDLIRQWASYAAASSEFGSSDWSAEQAMGEPDSFECGDQVTAWASASPQGVDWLDVGFATPVVPTEIIIHETYNPGSIVKVEVRDQEGSYHTAWEGTPAAVSECPREFVISIKDIDFKVTSVLISVDQSVLGDWDEIDAVELVGRP